MSAPAIPGGPPPTLADLVGEARAILASLDDVRVRLAALATAVEALPPVPVAPPVVVPEPVVGGRPGRVTDLRVLGGTVNMATLAFTPVDDGTGHPAQYALRYAVAPLRWPGATEVILGPTTPHAVASLAPGQTYEFQLVAFRGTLNRDAVFGGLSNVARWTTLGVPVLGGATGTHEPAGFTRVSERAFDATDEPGWKAWGGPAFSIVKDPDAPKSPPNVGEILFAKGFGGGYEPAFAEFTGLARFAYTRLYVAFWHRLSANWFGHPDSGVNKIGFLWIHGNPCVYWSAQGSGAGRLEPQIRLQNLPEGPNAGFHGGRAANLTPNLGGASYARGVWHQWETLLVCNTGDAANGEAHWWLDGVKVGAYTNIVYASGGQSHVWGDAGASLTWRPIWGGIGGTVPATQYQWMDHLIVSGAP